MALIRRVRYGKQRTTSKRLTVKDSVLVGSSTHDPDSGALLSAQFALDVPDSEPQEILSISLSREDIVTLHAYLLRSEARRGIQS